MAARLRYAVREAVSLCRVTSVAAAVPLLLRGDLRVVQRRLEPPRGSARGGSVPDPEELTAVAHRVERVMRRARPLVRRGCLTRGVTSYYLIRRLGLDVSLCFGMRPEPSGANAGHCWLELGGEPILEPADPRPAFTEVVRMSSRGVLGPPPPPAAKG